MNNLDKIDRILQDASNNKEKITVSYAMQAIWSVLEQATKNIKLTNKEESLLLSLATSFVATIHLESLIREGKITVEEAKEMSGADVVQTNKIDA